MIMISPRQPTLPLLFLSICVSNIDKVIPLYWGQTDLTFPRLLKYCEEAASTREWRWTTEPSSRWQTRSRKGSSAERSLALSKAAQSMLGWRVQRRQYCREESRSMIWLGNLQNVKLPAAINQRATTKLQMLKRIKLKFDEFQLVSSPHRSGFIV